MKQFLKFFAKCAAVCGAALLILILLNNRYREVMDHPYTDTHKFDYMDSMYTNIQICNIGSSHGEADFNYESLSKRYGYECFNFAMSSQTYNYDYALLSMYQEHFADRCLMFIPISCFSFNNEVTNEAERESLSAKYYTFLSPRYIPDYDPYVDIVTHYFPILSAGEEIKRLFPSLSLKAFAAEANAPDPALFQEKAANRYSRHMENKEEYFMPERIDDLYRILQFCEDNGITAILLTTPYTSYYSGLFTEAFKTQFYDTVHTIAAQTHTPYYDFSNDERFAGRLEYFSDADHLNEEGAVYFMEVIEEEIPEFQEFLQDTRPDLAGNPEWMP